MGDLFASTADLIRATGYKRGYEQVKCLAEDGVSARLNRRGEAVVLADALRQWMGEPVTEAERLSNEIRSW